MSEEQIPGREERDWSLSRAIDALGEAARQAGRPGLIWLAGAVYPGWTAFQLLFKSEIFQADRELPFQIALLTVPLWFVSARLMAGLARLAHPVDWQRVAGPDRASPGLRDAWRGGRGSTRSALGLWALVSGMMLLVLVLLLAPVAQSGRLLRGPFEPGALLVFVPLAAFLAVYAAVLSILHQLALHSLVRNRRGVASALVHAWRIARNDPARTFQAFMAELVLALSIHVGGLLIVVSFAWQPALAVGLGVALNGFGGVTRAAYWARAYRALGGLAPEDGVPGLAEEPQPQAG